MWQRISDAPAARWLTGTAGAGLGIAVLAAVATGATGPMRVPAALSAAVGWTFVAVGLVVWRRAATAAAGQLMCAVGLAWMVGFLGFSRNSYAFTAGNLFGYLYLALFTHLLLAFPGGPVRGTAARLLTRAGYLCAIGIPVLFHAFAPGPDCAGCPRNVLVLWPHRPVAIVVGLVGRLVSIGLVGAVVGLLVVRWRRASPVRRIGQAPVLAAAIGALIAYMMEHAYVVVGLVTGRSGGPAPAAFVLPRVLWALVPFGFLLGALRSRFARGGLADQIRELSVHADLPQLQRLLAAALHDPTLALYRWLPAAGRYLDVDNRPVDRLDPGNRVVTTLDGIGALLHDPAAAEEPELFGAVLTVARLGLHHALLRAELRGGETAAADTRNRLLETAAAERARIEQDLHDGAQQRLVSAAIILGRAQTAVARRTGRAAEPLDAAKAELNRALRQLRSLARGVYPPALAERGLRAAVEDLAWDHGEPIRIDWRLTAEPAPYLAVTAYEFVAAALADLPGPASIRVWPDEGAVTVRVEGAGTISRVGALAERIAAVGGSATATRRPCGTVRVEARLS